MDDVLILLPSGFMALCTSVLRMAGDSSVFPRFRCTIRCTILQGFLSYLNRIQYILAPRLQ